MNNEEALRMAYSKRKDSAGEERDFLNTIIQALERSKWISVNKQIPIKSDYYLATIKESSGEKVVRSIWYDGEWKIMSVVPNIIAWMPLPEPYNASPAGAGGSEG